MSIHLTSNNTTQTVILEETAWAYAGESSSTFNELELSEKWGWVINYSVNGPLDFEFWAGAGLNDLDKGVQIGEGTISKVNIGGVDHLRIELTIFSEYYIGDIHIFAHDEEPTTTARVNFHLMRTLG
jgi:hypothetical protein